MRFTKMHGCGNDYIYIWIEDELPEDDTYPECIHLLHQGIPDDLNSDLIRMVQGLSDRHYGIGADGVIFVRRYPTLVADFEMIMFNANGIRSAICGNGIRCVAKFVYEHGYTAKNRLEIVSGGVSHTVTCERTPGIGIERVTVNMGPPILSLPEIPCAIPPEIVERTMASFQPRPPYLIYCPMELLGTVYFFTPVSMGNPHAVVFLPPETDLNTFDVAGVGSKFERHPYFPEGVNTEFVVADDYGNARMRVWERGSGETLCCGTGCCAVTVAGTLTGMLKETVTVHARGGDVICNWNQQENAVYMTGPADTVFEGDIPV